MKRQNIYLYNCNNINGCKAIGFARLDIIDENNVKISIKINKQLLGMQSFCNVEIIPEVLIESGKSKRFGCRNATESLFDFMGEVVLDKTHDIVGIRISFVHSNGIRQRVMGLIEGRTYSEERVEKRKEEGIKKLAIEELVSLPIKYWHLGRNKFFCCAYEKYGHFGVMKKGEKTIICVPGDEKEQTICCAKRCGFMSYFITEDEPFDVYYMFCR